MTKLRPKNNSEKSISGFAAMLRGEKETTSSLPAKEDVVSFEKQPKIEDNIESSTSTFPTTPDVTANVNEVGINERRDDNTSFTALLSKIKEKDYNCKSSLYLDNEVKEVFQMLKTKGKIPIASLVSYILEQWVIENEDEIKVLLSGKKNRFM